MKIKEILIATKNKGKIKEFENMFEGYDIKIKTLYDYDLPDIRETGNSFYENALIKAKAGYEISSLPTISDDSGLEVEALGGKPGIYSARFGGEGLGDFERIEYLLGQLKGKNKRNARFITSLVYFDGRMTKEFKGVWNGVILEEPRGKNGFGYDPVFYDETLKRTAAELTKEEKRKVSHRGKAFKEFFKFFKDFI